MAEVIYGQRRRKQYWLLTTDPKTLPDKMVSLFADQFNDSCSLAHQQFGHP